MKRLSARFSHEDKVFISVAIRINREVKSGRMSGLVIRLDRQARRLGALLEKRGFQPTEEEAGAVLAGLVGEYQKFAAE